MKHPERSPFIDDYFAYLLARASTLVSHEFHQEVQAAGLAVSEWRILATLSDGRACTISELADIVLAKQPTVTKVVDRLENAGLVIRQPGTVDRRQSLVSGTPAGRRLAAPLVASAKAHEERLLQRFGATESAQLKATLRALIDELGPRRA
ncbi:MarR family transcriptional regulator [Pandoraea thiooxydans]|uniref:MarR family transcriptional regulator n=1 Tax=Pandoraea thiooxydans TaxID=445709 RepID=A0A0G3ET35_9BURK|nr:MarR family transcriptional regulator [Pandoraea thiooxydans]AKJ70238.1 MarR family transcriptional regulator [Pandoraea thiooxydans]APR93711.1 MarR family transcriptional regulator [Pandoraea thiooxydans]